MTGRRCPHRIVTLDVIRGVAVMGIFSVNVVAFAMIDPAYFNPGAYGGDDGDESRHVAGQFRPRRRQDAGLVLDPVRGLDAAGDRARRGGGPVAGARSIIARMVVLLLFGLLHFYFIWYGDILALYALIGMVAFLFRKLQRPRRC